MGRPKKRAEAALTERLFVRCTRAEREQLEAWMKATVVKSLSELMRRTLFGLHIQARIDQDTYYELRRIGNNLNQIARRLNSGIPVYLPELAQEYRALKRVLAEIAVRL